MIVFSFLTIYRHTAEGFENNRNICDKLMFLFSNIHYNTCRFWLKIYIYIYIYIYATHIILYI